MSYRSILHTVNGVKVGLFRPRSTDGAVVLLLGRAPENWYGGNESGQARALVQSGYWVVTVDTPNWGNQTDLDNIDEALLWAESSWGRSIDRLVVVAHEKGAVAGLHFSRLNPERVASLSLQAPIIDLETHYIRNASDQVSMQTAYGGSYATFLAAMPQWNPMRHALRYELRDFMRDRMRIWASPAETTTPAYVRLPGGAGNSVFTVDHARMDIVGDIDVRWFGAADNWASGSDQTLACKLHTLSNRTWRLYINSTGRPVLQLSTDGAASNNFTASVNPTVVNGQDHGIGFSWNQASGLITFYQSADGTNWTQLGTTLTGLAGQSLNIGTARTEIGAYNNGAGGIFIGNVKGLQISGVTQTEGTVNLSIDFTTKIAGSRYVVDDSGDFIWQIPGSSQLLGGSVTEQFATAVEAEYGVLASADPTTISPATLITPAVAKDTGWTQQLAARQTAKWRAYAKDSTLTTDWAGADGFHSIPLPDGRVLWTFSDTLTGTINGDGSRSGAVMINNSLVIEEADGTLGETVHAVGSDGPAIVPPDPGHYYWLNDGVIEQEGGNDVIRIFAYDSEHTGGGWQINEIHIVTLNATTFENIGYQVRPTTNATWNNFLERPDYTYVTGYVRDWIFNMAVIARTPPGSITGQWEYWDGTGWTTDESQVAYLKDNNGVDIEGDGSLYYHNGIYVKASKDSALWGDTAELWHATAPQGPYTKYYEHPIPEQGAERFGAQTTCYGAIFHPQIPASPGKIMAIYCVNGLGSDASAGQNLNVNNIDSSIYQARFFEVPLPE